MTTPKTILVVDDEPGYRDMVEFEFSDAGYRVVTAAGGPEALELLKRRPVDLVITDMKMSPMDGLEVFLAARSLHPRLPFLLMTGHAVEERVQRALSLKASACLRKPFHIDDLKKAVEAALA